MVSSRLLASFKNISQTAGISGIVLGCLVLIGWQFDIPSLKSVLPGLATMKANTAIAFILVGASLWLRGNEKSNRQVYFAAQACAGVATLLGLLTLGEYISGLNFGIDQLLYRDLQTTEASFPGRMSLTTAFNFALLGTALLILDAETRRNFRPAQFLALITGAVASIALIGYIYSVDSLYSVGLYSSMALHTALGSAFLSLGILCARPQKGFMEIAVTETAGGIVLRRLMPLTIVILVVLGWLRLRGQQAGFYDTNFGLALMVLFSAASLSVVLWINAARLNRVDAERGQAQVGLQESEEKYRMLFESIDQGFCTIEVLFDKGEKPVDYRFLIVNPAFERQTGIPNAAGRRMREIAPLHEEHWFRIYGEIALTGEPMRFENPAEQLQRYYEVYAWKVGMPVERKVAILFNDITERKRAEEKIRKLNEELEQRVIERTDELSQANALLNAMMDNVPDHIFFKDVHSRFLRNSRSQALMMGLNDPAETIGKSDFDFFSHAQLSYEKEQEIIRSGKPLVDLEEQVVWPDGRETWVSTTKMPLFDQAGQSIGTFGISRDITERKRAEAALQKAKLELEAANKELEAFSYSVSHDLRAPLRTIDGFSQALLEDYGKQLPEEAQGYLTRVRSGAQRMAELIDDLLNLSHVTRSLMKSIPVNLTKLAEDIAAELRQAHPERSVRLSIAPNLNVRGDPHLLQVVLENFLNNAWKFTSKREQAEIEFGSRDEIGETIYFVRDNGAGFDMTYASKLFGAFQRLHAMTEYPGTGIGLATVQRIIHRHGGRIWAEAEVDQGATFFFTLPALERAKPKAVQQEKEFAKRIMEII